MHEIPYQRFAGSVFAFGSYGLPTLAGRRVSRRTLLILGIVGVLFTLYAAGVIDGPAAGLLAAGPVAEFVPSAAARAKGEEVAKDRKDIADIFAAHRKGDGYDMPAEKVAEIRGLNDAVAVKAAAYDEMVTLEKQAFDNDLALKGLTTIKSPMAPDQLGGPSDGGDGVKARDLREVFGTKSGELKSIASGERGTISFDLTESEYVKLLTKAGVKTLTSGDIAPQADRQAIVPSAQFLSDVTDLFTPGSTESDTIEFYEETTFTNNAAETAEGSAATESVLDFTLRSFPVQEIDVWTSVTRRTLADVSQIQSYVEGRLTHMLNTRRSGQLLAGNGTTPNLRGILQTSGIQTQAKGSDPIPDAVYKAMVLARTTGDAEPTGAIFHAQDWQDVRLLRTIDGVYIWGSPSEAGPERIWGLTARISNSITQNTGLVGGFRPYAQVFRREGARVEVSTEHSTFFTERKAAILLYERLALAVYRPAAFVSVTGI